MHYAFVDESGEENPSSKEQFLVVATLSLAQLREVELAVKRARRRFAPHELTGEMKAHKAPVKVVQYLLTAISRASVEIIATVVDKHCIQRRPAEPVILYRAAVARAVYYAAERHPILDVCIDRRYTTNHLRQLLDDEIGRELARLPDAKVILHHERSDVTPCLQAVDFIAWSFYQKYVRGDPSYCQIIEQRIVSENVIRQPLW